jgi:hypothetical protein
VSSRLVLRIAAAAVLFWAFGAAAVVEARAATEAPALHSQRRCAERKVELTVRTVPAFPNVRFTLAGQSFFSDARGIARIQANGCGTYRLGVVAPGRPSRGARTRFSRWGDNVFTAQRKVKLTGKKTLEVGFEVDYLVDESFEDLGGRPLDTRRVSRVVQSNSLGSRESFAPGGPRWLAGSRTIRRFDGLQPTEILYSVRRVIIDGSNVVREAQQRFYPVRTRQIRIRLLLYSARISARDRLFGFPIGSGLLIRYPDGHQEFQRFASSAALPLESLPRGTYDVTVKAPGLSSTVPIALTKNQVVVLKVVSYIDVGFVFGLASLVAIALLLARRPRLRARLRPRLPRRRGARALTGLGLLLSLATPFSLAASRTASAAVPAAANPVPVLAYYYIWFDHGSWRRAKINYPLLGRYSSDDVSVMRRHVEWAKQAGINGFIVSWKSTPTLNRRLAKLIRVADAQNFKLAIIYQGLDFAREPLPADRVARDLQYFARTYGSDRAFDLFGKPIVIWSGTWRFSRRDIALVTRRVRPALTILASEKSAGEYERISDLVDGDAYYWSSVNPTTFPTYGDKLTEMSNAIRRRGGMWIAPAAPGFDARLVGGTSVVDRAGGATLRREFDAATSSSPDAIGLISWNEFSENSEVEPSQRYGSRDLEALADILGTKFSARTDFDSNDPPGSKIGYGVPLIAGFGFILFTALLVRIWRKEIRNVARKPL